MLKKVLLLPQLFSFPPRNMTSKKITAVFGATGAQGGSVARAILENKNFAVRVVTRDVTRPNALALRDLGAELVKGDLNDEASVGTILKGAYGAFVVTNFWDHLSKEKEVHQGKTVAARACSTRGTAARRARSGGRLRGASTARRRRRTASGPPQDQAKRFHLVEAPDGDYYTLALPMGDILMDGISVADVGAVVASIFNSPGEFLGKAVGLSAEAPTTQKYADVLSKGLGKEVRDAKITPEAYEKLGFPAAKEIADMCCFCHTRPDRDVKLTHQLNPKVKSFSQFISENQGALKGM